MLTIDRLSKSLPATGTAYRRTLLDAVSLQAKAGELVAIVGESGSGKSTLLNLIAGIEQADSGRIDLAGAEITGLHHDQCARLRRQKFGFVFQAFHILPHLTVGQNVELPLWLQGVATAPARQRALDALHEVELAERAPSWPRELSGGELQRVAVARALVHCPQLVLADEPTGNLDPENADRVLALLARAVRQANATGLLVTHSPTAAARADRILRLGRDGRLAPA